MFWVIILLASSAQQAVNGKMIEGCTCATSLDHFEIGSIPMDPETTLVLDYLPDTMTVHGLCGFFSSFGSVLDGYIESYISVSGHRLCGYLHMATAKDASRAAEATNGQDFDGFHVISFVLANPPQDPTPAPEETPVDEKPAGFLV